MVKCAILVSEEAPENRIRFVKNMKLIPPCQRLTKRTINFTNFFCEVSRSINFEQPCFFPTVPRNLTTVAKNGHRSSSGRAPTVPSHDQRPLKMGCPSSFGRSSTRLHRRHRLRQLPVEMRRTKKKVIKCLKINFLPPFYLITRAWWFQQVARLPGWLPSISVVEFWTFWTSPPPLPPSKTKPEHTVLRWKETKNHRSFSGWHHISITSGTRTCSSVKPVIIIDIDDRARQNLAAAAAVWRPPREW